MKDAGTIGGAIVLAMMRKYEQEHPTPAPSKPVVEPTPKEQDQADA